MPRNMFIIMSYELRPRLWDLFPFEKGLGTCAWFHSLAFIQIDILADFTFGLEGVPPG